MSLEGSDNVALCERSQSLFSSALDTCENEFGCVLPDRGLTLNRPLSSVGSGLDLAGNERASGMDARHALGRERLPVLEPECFDGACPVGEYLRRFRLAAVNNGWSRETQSRRTQCQAWCRLIAGKIWRQITVRRLSRDPDATQARRNVWGIGFIM